MSFRCGVCDDAQPTGTKPKRIVLEFRPKRYYYFDRRGDECMVEGTEIAREADACDDCAAHNEHMLKGGHAVG